MVRGIRHFQAHYFQPERWVGARACHATKSAENQPLGPSAKDSAPSALSMGFFTAEDPESFAEGESGLNDR